MPGASAAPAARPRGFPDRFPVHDDLHRPLRYRACALLCRVGMRGVFGSELVVRGLDHVPRTGPLLLCANHLSNLDPLLMGAYTPGANSAMAKRELFWHPLLAWLLAGCNVFPVDRGAADRWALRTATDILARGGRLMVWLEGTRSSAPGMRRAEPGIGFLWRRCPVPVLPIAVTGTEASLVRGHRIPRRVPVSLTFGAPVDLEVPASERRDNQAIADRMGRLIATLLPPGYRGVYGEATEVGP